VVVGLNIKNEHVHELAREAARRTGKSQTSVIEEALEKLLADLEHERGKVGLKEDIMAIAADFQARMAAAGDGPLSSDWLYDDETGLPV
jgi:antitoxin VapB